MGRQTVQSISVLAYLMEAHDIWGPFLVIAPASTLFNWQQELARFVPDVKALPYWGNPKERALLSAFPVTGIEFKGLPTDDQVNVSPIQQGTLQFPGMEKLERNLIPSENLKLRLRRAQILELEHVSDSIQFASDADATAIAIVPEGGNAMPTFLDVMRYRYGVGEVLGFVVYFMALMWAIFKNPKVEIGPEIGP